jgi:hypothetical protein
MNAKSKSNTNARSKLNVNGKSKSYMLSRDLVSTAGSSVDGDSEFRKLFQGSEQMADKMKPRTTPDLRHPVNIIGATLFLQ